MRSKPSGPAGILKHPEIFLFSLIHISSNNVIQKCKSSMERGGGGGVGWLKKF